MQPITLKEAEQYDIEAYNKEQKRLRLIEMEKDIERINEIICIHLETIKTVGYHNHFIFWKIDLSYITAIEKEFVDFKVRFFIMTGTLSIMTMELWEKKEAEYKKEQKQEKLVEKNKKWWEKIAAFNQCGRN